MAAEDLLSDHQVYLYKQNGFVNAGPLISEAEATELADEILSVVDHREDQTRPQPIRVANLSREDQRPIWQIVNIWQASEAFKQLLKNAKLKYYISKLTGKSDFKIWHDQVQYKPSHVGGRLSWHQDLPKWPVMKGGTQLTAWVALDDAGPQNGCMVMVPGSHLRGNQNEWLHQHDGGWQLGHNESFKSEPTQVLCPVQKGHVHFHDSLTWHSSGPNLSGQPRRAIAMHFMDSETLFNSRGDHIMKEYIASADGQPIQGNPFLPI